jgi:hypothetical protein
VSSFTARCLVVAAAIALLVVGVLSPVGGGARAVLIGAAACCAVVDVVLHRSPQPVHSDPVVVVAPAAPAPEPDAPSGRPDGEQAPGSLVLGHRPDGRRVEATAAPHVVVVGAGVLADAVFRGVAEQVRASAGAAAGDDVRSITAAGPRHGDAGDGPGGDGDALGLPEHTAVLARLDARGRAVGSVVLVAGLGALPRRWDVAVEVTRYGCSVRRPDEQHGVRVRPVLPLLSGDPVVG